MPHPCWVGQLLSYQDHVFRCGFVQYGAYSLLVVPSRQREGRGEAGRPRASPPDRPLDFRREGGRSARPRGRTENHIHMPRRSTPDAFALQVGARIRELRYEMNMSLAALADASELSKGHLSSVEHGLAAITIGTIARLAEGFGVPPMYLLTFAAEDERAHAAELLRHLPQSEVRKLRRQIQAQVAARK
ncbi:helix-turn-helix domain-containing protein [Polyangium spumosum]|uniref:Helix-turn-helix domain-containing protein n=2 Tax=Polyangium spumosum TaxID=889282 RepID=A0A6N7PUC0_9BACT|nr:helix-turn-helix domain-containing protein [Polyangium spumosum]